jgi:two-component system chemotaxis sensor kinase CheA
MFLKGKRVFVVEDDMYNLAIATVFLEQNGAIMRFERWGVHTVDRLRAFAPVDVILLDIMLPRGVTGFDVFNKIREIHDFDKVPIVAVTAADPDKTMKEAREKGFAGFIAKPISTSFAKHVAEVLNVRSLVRFHDWKPASSASRTTQALSLLNNHPDNFRL